LVKFCLLQNLLPQVNSNFSAMLALAQHQICNQAQNRLLSQLDQFYLLRAQSSGGYLFCNTCPQKVKIQTRLAGCGFPAKDIRVQMSDVNSLEKQF
jgi:hypothetical protein